MKISDNPYYLGVYSKRVAKIDNTAEDIVAFIMKVGRRYDILILTHRRKGILSTNGVFIHRCLDNEFLQELKKALDPRLVKYIEGLDPTIDPT